MNTTLHLATTFLYNVSRWWSLYLDRCVTALSSEDVGATGETIPFSLEPILLKLEGGHYVGPLLPLPLADLVSGRRGGSGGTGGGNGSGGNRKGEKEEGCGGGIGGGSGGGSGEYGGKSRGAVRGGASGGGGGAGSTARVQARYDVHLPALSLRDRENLRTIL